MERAHPRGEPPARRHNAPWADSLFAALTQGAAWLTLALLAGIIVSLFVGAAPAIREFGVGFLWSKDWDPVQEKFGGLVMIYGTLMTSFIALLIAVPVSFGIALFLTEMSPGWLKRPLGIAIELLAAVPSIVYGMWGLLVFSPILSTYVQQPLQSLLKGVPLLQTFVSGAPVGIGILFAWGQLGAGLPPIAQGVGVLALGERRATGQQQGAVVFGVFLQNTLNHAPGLTVKTAATHVCQQFNPLQGNFVVGVQRSRLVKRLQRLIAALQAAVGAAQHHPAFGIVGVGLKLLGQHIGQLTHVGTIAVLRCSAVSSLWVHGLRVAKRHIGR